MPINIQFKPSTKQFKAWQKLTDNTTNFIGYGGAAFGGKSYLLCYWLTSMSIGYPGTGWGLGRKELVNLKRTTLLTLFKVFQECGINEKHYNFNQQLNVITFFNGSQIFLIDMAYKPSDPLYTRFGGYELTGAAVDESAESEHTAIEILFTRIGRRLNKHYNLTKKFLETFNPAKNHVYRRYYRPYRDGELVNTYAFIPALPKDNPSPEVEEYIEGILQNATIVTKERLIYGNFEYDDDPATLIDIDSINDYFSNEHIKPDGKKYITADIARLGKDSTVVRLWHGWKVIKRVEEKKTTVTESADIIKSLANEAGIPKSQICVDEDGVGGGVKDILKCKGFVNNSTPINVDKKDKQNYENLKSQCSFRIARRIVNKEIYEECKDSGVRQRISEEMEQVKSKSVDKDSKLGIVPKDKVKELLGRSPDDWDSIMMREYFELKRMGIRAYA